jgi:peptidoglycan/LPS O-acetylase OafA/YrhL
VRLDHFTETARTANNFDLLRLVAAILVVFAHSFDLLQLPEPFLGIAPAGWGYVGVLIFFSISGFLVSRSWVSDPRLTSFALKRALRLLPALVVALLLSALVLGPLVTSEAPRAYFDSPATKAYVLDNTVMQSDFALPGVFLHNVYPGAVNGSLWTLPLEVKAYFLVALLGIVGLLSRRRFLMVAVAAFVVLACIDSLRPSVPGASHFVASLVDIQASPELVAQAKLGGFTVYAELLAAFTVGATLFALRRWVPLRWQLGVCAVAGWGIATLAFHNATLAVSTVVLGPYIVLCLAYLSVGFIRMPRSLGDYSYGIYIYAFPVQQTISDLLAPTSGWVMFALSLPITCVVAVASWHLVERRALGLKRRLVNAELPRASLRDPAPG